MEEPKTAEALIEIPERVLTMLLGDYDKLLRAHTDSDGGYSYEYCRHCGKKTLWISAHHNGNLSDCLHC